MIVLGLGLPPRIGPFIGGAHYSFDIFGTRLWVESSEWLAFASVPSNLITLKVFFSSSLFFCACFIFLDNLCRGWPACIGGGDTLPVYRWPTTTSAPSRHQSGRWGERWGHFRTFHDSFSLEIPFQSLWQQFFSIPFLRFIKDPLPQDGSRTWS